MLVLEIFFFLLSWLFFLFGIFVIFSCLISLIRFGDFFIRVHTIKIANIYGISSVLIGLAITKMNFLIFLQIFLIILLNILITITIIHAISRIAINNNIKHGGFSRRKYNEMLTAKEKEESEKRAKEMKKIAEENTKQSPTSNNK